MNTLTFFLFIITVASVVYFLGHQIGYLRGKAEASHIPRGEPPEEDILGSELKQIISFVETGERK